MATTPTAKTHTLLLQWYGMVWYSMVWYGMVWYGMLWYGMVWYVKGSVTDLISI